jgi:hypothetical protein
MTDERESMRATFDAAADRYDRARPEYPDELFDELVRRTNLTRGSQAPMSSRGRGQAVRGIGLRCHRLEHHPREVSLERSANSRLT